MSDIIGRLNSVIDATGPNEAREIATDARDIIAGMRGALRYLDTQARNGTLHPQVVVQNARKWIGGAEE